MNFQLKLNQKSDFIYQKKHLLFGLDEKPINIDYDDKYPIVKFFLI